MSSLPLYTLAQVQDAQLRALVGMALISDNIQSGFYYFTPTYGTYKNLQYDIYTLYSTVTNELGFITFSSNPTAYEYQFYDIVGSLINKTKQVDVFGKYGGSINPYYQDTLNGIVVDNGSGGGTGVKTLTAVLGVDSRLTYNGLQLIFTYDAAAIAALGNTEPIKVLNVDGYDAVSVAPLWDASGAFPVITWDGFSSITTATLRLFNA